MRSGVAVLRDKFRSERHRNQWLDMRTTDYWPSNTRIIEFGAPDGAIGDCLVDAGYSGYLAVAHDGDRRSSTMQRYQHLGSRVAVNVSPKVVSQNNADVLILNGRFLLQLARFSTVRHAQFVGWRLRPTLLCFVALVVAVGQTLLGRVGWPRVVWCEKLQRNRELGASRRLPLIVWRVRRPRPLRGVRRFIPHNLGVAEFFRRLHQQDARYAVLRWFETLPDVAPGEDIDLLVADDDLELMRAVLDEGPGIQPVDLYSVTGLPGADFQGVPYYPPHLAEELLSHTVTQGGRYRVPAPREHFLSLAYHALYHKGADSGLPREANEKPTATCDHDYAATLQRLAKQAGFDTPVTLEDLDALLDSACWRPPHDMLVRLARRNHWVHAQLGKPELSTKCDDRLAVFLVREVALLRGGVKKAVGLLEQRDFQIIATEVFDATRAARIARTIRGGNWGRGPWPISGGLPCAAIVVFDPAPIEPSQRQRQRFPFLANARLLCKEQLRECFNVDSPVDQHCNVIHSSDNGREALDYLRVTMPYRVEEILARASVLAEGRVAA